MLDLPSLYPELRSILQDQLTALADIQASQRGDACESLCSYFRTTGVAALLFDLDVDEFHHMLIRSGLTRVYLLQNTSDDEKAASRYCRITRSNGLFDAVAAGQFETARRIVSLSPAKWNRRLEYEDDYCYIRFLHETVWNAKPMVREEVLNRFADVVADDTVSRCDVCRALLDKDDEAFDGAFSNILDDWAAEIEFQSKSISRDEVEFAAAQHVFVEGLALLRIAEGEGIETLDEYPYCPHEARQPMQTPFPDDGYPK